VSFLALSQVMAEGGGVLGGLGINAFLLIAQVINFILLVLFLNGLLLKPLMKGLEDRRKRVEESLENARKADERLANVEKDYQARLAVATAEAQRIHAEALRNAQAEIEHIRREAAAAAETIKAQAHAEAVAERDQMLAELRSQVAALALAAADKIVEDALDPQRQQVLVKEFFGKLPASVLSEVRANGHAPAVTVTSALPLTPGEQECVRADLGSRLGAVAALDFRVDPAILGGLVVRVGDKIIDGSVAGRRAAMQQSLNS
jgi:F-type H+-transporting ATPase subunit b